MTALTWDKVGERLFQTGVDRGVLYLHDGTTVVWNGLTGVEDGSLQESQSFYLDGVKYLEKITPGDYSGKLRAFTYPAEFDHLVGIEPVAPGLFYHDQSPKSFNLSYRTLIGNNAQGTDYGYKIHILYNLVANPELITFETIRDPLKPIEFSWALTGTPPSPAAKGYRPTVHISIDSTQIDEDTLETIEDILWGTPETDPWLPSIDEIRDLFQTLGSLIIVDNGDGTWKAIDTGNEYITMVSSTEFRIANADATYLDATTYTITTTHPEPD